MFSSRGGLTCHAQNQNAGTAASAILRGSWNLRQSKEDSPIDFRQLNRFIEEISMSTISGRLVWDCGRDAEKARKTIEAVQRQVLSSWIDQGELTAWSSDVFVDFHKTEDPLIRDSVAGMIELHWLAPAMTLEQNALVISAFIAVFTIVPTAFVVISATPLLQWQSPISAALLIGGQALLGVGNFLAQWVLRLQRISAWVQIPREGMSDTWMLVDNTWFTGRLARRRLPRNPLSPNTITLGQHLRMEPYIPAWQALPVMFTIALGFVTFYIGARSSSLWVILFEIVSNYFGNIR